ncbi:C69 family dipeptidase [Parabacteroides sp. PF5-9]|uniref:dipeptidase n=1 Tax=Parabacteroides sp. PF5-9 TaxID=1742404 RepID=UPI0024771741|nr:C69 family dipeptidase [Parabacteroides sp. PF5-9]MDH6357829.1 dipeptidase [Parabacteroides sp. PF5-9]
MKKRTTLFLLFFITLFYRSTLGQEIEYAQPVNDPESCTSIMVGKKASADGSVMTSHTCDGNYRTWMEIVPAATYERDTVTGIYDGLMHTEFIADQSKWVLKGSIPQTRSTYQFLNTSYPCFNEKQLGIGETTITGRKELVNKNGMFMIEELQRLALQRCTTAREAIRLMGDLVKKYGYADWGECLTIADTKEVWHFEVFGEGPDKIGGVWAAIRIPDDHVGVSANIPRISSVNIKDTENCMASENVFDVAKKLRYWDGKEPFSFWKAYGGGKKAFNIREYFILNKLAPSLNLSYDAEELPFSVKPEKTVAATDVMALLRETYEGTQWDMTQHLKVAVKKTDSEEKDTIISHSANPWMTMDMVNMLNGIKEETVTRYRLVSVPQCSYSVVIQLRDWLPDDIGGIAWLSFDNPGQSPRIPVFCGTTNLPDCFGVCGQHRFREDAVVWKYRQANKLATVRWGLTKDKIVHSVNYFETKAQRELSFVEQQYEQLEKSEGKEHARNYLTGYTKDFAGATMLRWEELKNEFWKMFARGF